MATVLISGGISRPGGFFDVLRDDKLEFPTGPDVFWAEMLSFSLAISCQTWREMWQKETVHILSPGYTLLPCIAILALKRSRQGAWCWAPRTSSFLSLAGWTAAPGANIDMTCPVPLFISLLWYSPTPTWWPWRRVWVYGPGTCLGKMENCWRQTFPRWPEKNVCSMLCIKGWIIDPDFRKFSSLVSSLIWSFNLIRK